MGGQHEPSRDTLDSSILLGGVSGVGAGGDFGWGYMVGHNLGGCAMSLWHCYANGLTGRFGDYVLARTKAQAVAEFFKVHNAWPTQVWLERRAK